MNAARWLRYSRSKLASNMMIKLCSGTRTPEASISSERGENVEQQLCLIDTLLWRLVLRRTNLPYDSEVE
jgi:hypothetical protein